jgi:hypothetical protein
MTTEQLLLRCKEIQSGYPDDNLHWRKIQEQIEVLEKKISNDKK